MNRITSIGEILFDIYPECKTLGGAPFNFLYHIKKLTGAGNFVSRIGNDEEGKQILELLSRNNISTKYIQVDNYNPTGESIAILDELKIPSWVIKQDTAYDFIETTNDIKELIDNETDCLYFGTLAQRGTITRTTTHNFFNKDIKYFCDLNIRQNFYSEKLIKECISASDVLKLNIDEFQMIKDFLISKSYNTNEVVKRIINEYRLDILCITYGENGADIYNENGFCHHKVKTRNVIDTIGAGDAYAAILCLGYLQNWDIEKINITASEFASEIVKINGALPTGSSIYDKFIQLISSN